MPRHSSRLPVYSNDRTSQSFNWGKPNELRGRNFSDLAIKFKLAFKEGSILSQDEFDAWAASEGLPGKPQDDDKKSDGWLAHLQRRHQLRYNLNKAATHPRMNTAGVGAYVIVALKGGLYKVEPPHERLAEHEITSKVKSLVETKSKQLNYLMQSTDWTLLPRYQRDFAEALYFDIDQFKKHIEFMATGLNTKFKWLADKLKAAVESGDIHPNNGGIRQMLAPPPVAHDATIDAENDTEDDEPSKPAQEAVEWDENEPYC